MFEVITTISTNLLRTYIIYRFMSVFFQTELEEKKKERLCYFLFFAVTAGVHMTFHFPPATMTVNIIFIYVITTCYDGRIRKRIFVTLLVYAVNAGCDFVSVHIMTNYTVTHTIREEFSYLTVFLFSVFEFVVEKLFIKSKGKSDIPHWNMLMAISGISIIEMIVISLLGTHKRVLVILLCLSVLLVDLLIFRLYDVLAKAYKDLEKKALYEKQVLIYSNQLDVLARSEEKVRTLRHDLKNHLTELTVMAKNHQHQESIEYIQAMEAYIQNPDELVSSGNKNLDSLMNYLLGQAKKKLDKVEYDIFVPKDLEISAFDFNVILGNLFDNAIEAASISIEKWMMIYIKYEKGTLSIEIKNSFNQKLMKQGSLYLSTKEESGHGIGLINIKRTVEKYNGTIEIIDRDHIFEVRILLYV